MAKLGDYASFIMGQAPASSDCNVDGIGTPFVKAGQFGESTPIINEWTTNPLKIASDADVLICVVGATSGKLNRGVNCAIGRSVAAIRPQEKVIRDYIYYGLHPWIQRLRSGSQGSAIGVITKEMLATVEMPFPEEKQQKEIVKTLSLIENVTRKRKEELVKLDDLIKSRFLELFGTYPANEKGWDTGTIRDLVTDVRYGSSRKAADGNSGKYPYLRMNNITYSGELDLSDTKTIDIPDGELDKCTVRRGDVLFNRTNSKELVGKTCVYNRDELMVLAGFIVRVRLNDKAYPEFVSTFLNTDFSKQMLINMCKTAIGQANINAQELQNIGIYIPPKEIQNKFISFKSQVDKSKAAVQAALDEAQLLFDSLMQEYFG